VDARGHTECATERGDTSPCERTGASTASPSCCRCGAAPPPVAQTRRLPTSPFSVASVATVGSTDAPAATRPHELRRPPAWRPHTQQRHVNPTFVRPCSIIRYILSIRYLSVYLSVIPRRGNTCWLPLVHRLRRDRVTRHSIHEGLQGVYYWGGRSGRLSRGASGGCGLRGFRHRARSPSRGYSGEPTRPVRLTVGRARDAAC
jgi:hypothetical protein